MFAMKFVEIQTMTITLEIMLAKIATDTMEMDALQTAQLKMGSIAMVAQHQHQILAMKNVEMSMI